MNLVVGPVDPARTYALRQRVLRPSQTIEEVARDSDIDGATTFGAFESSEGPVLATATIYPEHPPVDLVPIVELASTRVPWRLRAVATEAHRRGEGLGRLVLDAIIEHVTRESDAVIWCYARVSAREFYERALFVSFGEIFEVEGIGPHVVMYRSFDRGPRTEN